MKRGRFSRGITKKNSHLLLLGILSVTVGILFDSAVIHDTGQRFVRSEIFPGLQTFRKGDDVNEYIKKQLVFCEQFPDNSKDKFSCSKSAGEYLSSTFDFGTIVNSLESSGLDCHDEMHYVVNSEYKKGATMQKIWSQCSDACFGACYHGGLEGLIEGKQLAGKDDEVIVRALEQECDTIKDPYSAIYYQCFHGIGHAFMLLADGNLPESLKLCDRLKDFTHNCYEGVFMENIPTSRTAYHTKSFIKSDDILYPCNIIDIKYQKICYSFQVTYITQSTIIDPEKPFEICLDFPDEFRDQCYSQIAIPYFDTKAIDQPKLRQVCDKFPEGQPKGSCIWGGVLAYADRFPVNSEKLSSVYNYCNAVDSSYKKDCFLEAFKRMRQAITDKQTRDAYCSKIVEDRYKQLCHGNDNK